MSGIVQAVLTDKEIVLLLEWFAAARAGIFIGPEDLQLLAKLEGYASATACPTGDCAVPRGLVDRVTKS